ncbi:MAG: MlaD family protein [Desulfuromonadales bacterium]
MSEENTQKTHADKAPEAVVRTKRSFSIIWVVPIIALLIGGWLTFKAMREKGPEITITFETAEGLVAGKTQIKYKDVEVGKVTDIDLGADEDLSGVTVTAEMTKEAKPYLTDKSQFWVVRARVAAGEIHGLGTLLSGAYIGIHPSMEGTKTRRFKGLEKQPLLTEGQPGRHFTLQSRALGSLDQGSPVYYRGIKVGKVVDYNYAPARDGVDIKLFVEAPFHEKVLDNSRFWNASGVDFTMDATGINMNTESLVSIMLGGITFDLREHDLPGEPAAEDQTFRLFADYDSGQEDIYEIQQYALLYFEQSVRGLSPGAPVEILGIKIGEVVKVELEYDLQKIDFRIPVLIVMEPERIHTLVTQEGEVVKGAVKEIVMEEHSGAIEEYQRTQALIDKGLRGQLKTGNLLTGQLYVDLAFYPDAPPVKLRMEGDYPVFPTIPAPLEQIAQRVDNILKKVEKIPFEQIGEELKVAIESLTATLDEVKAMSGKVNEQTIPKLNASMDKLQETLDGIKSTLGPDSALNYNARKVTSELALAIRSIRSLLEYLERDPQALILGKEGGKK